MVRNNIIQFPTPMTRDNNPSSKPPSDTPSPVKIDRTVLPRYGAVPVYPNGVRISLATDRISYEHSMFIYNEIKADPTKALTYYCMSLLD